MMCLGYPISPTEDIFFYQQSHTYIDLKHPPGTMVTEYVLVESINNGTYSNSKFNNQNFMDILCNRIYKSKKKKKNSNEFQTIIFQR